VNSGAFFNTRQLGPSTRVMEIDLYTKQITQNFEKLNTRINTYTHDCPVN